MLSKTLQVGLCASLLWAAHSSVFAQAQSSIVQSPGAVVQPFAGFDTTLARAADTLLVTPAQSHDRAIAKAMPDEIQGDERTPHSDTQPRVPSHIGFTLAAARVDLLRPVIDPILRSHGVPANMAAVVVVESGGHPTALSPKGARGLWQLMPDTARRYGLRVDESHDDRLDLFKATDAAARYLHDLYAQFGDWKLALAAYNTGEANLGAAILKAHTQDFDQLVNLRILPLETRNYVPRVLAAQSLEQPSIFGEAHSPSSTINVFASSER